MSSGKSAAIIVARPCAVRGAESYEGKTTSSKGQGLTKGRLSWQGVTCDFSLAELAGLHF